MRSIYKMVSFFMVFVMVATMFCPALSAGAAAPRTVVVSETTADNDDFETAQIISSDYLVNGYISSRYDIDFYRVDITAYGDMQFKLSHENDGRRYSVDVYWANPEYDQEYYCGAVTYNGETSISGGYVGIGDAFYISVVSYSGYSATKPYTLEFDLEVEHTFYSQLAPNTADYVRNFSNTYYDDSTQAPQDDWQELSWYENYRSYGCYVSSFAMILNNLNKTTMRSIPNLISASGSYIPSQYMEACPYAVMWANTTTGNATNLSSLGTSITYSNGNYLIPMSARDLCSFHETAVETLFDVNIEHENVSGLSDTTKKNMIANMLADNPEGIVAIFIQYNGSQEIRRHAVVFTHTDYIATELNYTRLAEVDNNMDVSLNSTTNKGSCVVDDINSIANRAAGDFSDADKFKVFDPANTSVVSSLANTYTAGQYSGWGDLRILYYIE